MQPASKPDVDAIFGIGLGGRLHELARVGVERFEITPLALSEDDVEGQCRFARTRNAGHHGKLIARDFDVDVFQIVFAGVVHANRG